MSHQMSYPIESLKVQPMDHWDRLLLVVQIFFSSTPTPTAVAGAAAGGVTSVGASVKITSVEDVASELILSNQKMIKMNSHISQNRKHRRNRDMRDCEADQLINCDKK
jgi:hypothetical protein